MDQPTIRITALQLALGMLAPMGITCEACVTKAASTFAAFIENGTVATEHDMPVELAEEPEDDSNVVTFDPTRKH